MSHDDKRGEKIAGFWHIGFAVMYLIAAAWHLKGSIEHFKRTENEYGKSR